MVATMAVLMGCVDVPTSPDEDGNTDDQEETCDWESPGNGWTHSEPPACLVGEGFGLDEIAPAYASAG